ncbi:Cys-tRNA(Pro) deacylase [Corynebacterium halotolerans]|uniref:Cys-tRNA(Pro) deacylase n=1 Tax=Corynebacterium halotolerans TaxID=225326 RepID=UPI003CF0EBCB
MAKAPTKAVQALLDVHVPHRLEKFDSGRDHFGAHAAAALGVAPELILKTLIVDTGTGLAVCCVPVSGQLDLKAAAKALGVRKVTLADPAKAEKSTGYVTGGISPLGQKTPLPTLLDAAVEQVPLVYVSGGRRGLDIELAPQDLAQVTAARFVPLGR